jgi:hypothetical protein
MESRNIEGFKQAHPGMRFPDYRSLKANETLEIRRRLKQITKLPEIADDLTLTRQIATLSKICSDENADDEKFNLLNTLKSLNISPNDKVFVNFYRFDEIDELPIEDVSRYFRFIWYPASDDIDIFDETLEWILSVTHSGIIRALVLET